MIANVHDCVYQTKLFFLFLIAHTSMSEQKHGERIRLKLESPNPDGRTAGFITINTWMFDLKIPASTDSTPVHRPNHGIVLICQASFMRFMIGGAFVF